MYKFILLIFATLPVLAGPLTPLAKPYDFSNAPEYQAILTQLKPHGDYSDKTAPEPVAPKTMSRGQQMVEEAKAKNRALLAENNAAEKKSDEKKSELAGPEQWKKEVRETHKAWQQEILDQRKIWQKEQQIFLGRLKIYKENTFELPVKVEKIIEKKVEVNNLPEVHIVNGTFEVPIRDQKNRPTCSAFAGVRALEIILAQNKVDKDLSEQYFYWASKPDCHDRPCNRRGSWVTPAYRYSQNQSEIDIPVEDSCAYKTDSVADNETQIPLTAACHQGVTKVTAWEEVRTLADVIEKLKQDTPVIVAAKLSENFYRNQGLVTLADSTKNPTGKMDAHALGHAFLAVGVMELPAKLKATEGSYCIIVANSWGKGWGAGGYSCLTENWLTKFRQPSPFVAVTKITTR